MSVEVFEASPGRYVLKIFGLPCPYLTKYTFKTLEKIRDDEVLEVTFDNQPSFKTIQEAVIEKS